MTALRLAFAFTASVACVTAAAAAPVRDFDLPAGNLGTALTQLGRQAGLSISVADAGLWRRPVPPLKGRMAPREAIARLLRGIDARIVEIDAQTFRIVALARPAPGAAVRPSSPPRTTGSDESPIIVTASKRDIRLRDYPGMASVLDGKDLAFGGERGTESILSRLASVSSTHLGAGRNKLFIRGIADSSFTGPTQATVGQYLGDIRLNYNAPDPDLRLYDVASVEVLEGPQGTLYGAGSLGGIIRIVGNAPRLDTTEASVSAGVSATQHGDPSGDLGGMVNLPLSPHIALRAVGYGITDGGYIDDVLRGKHNINRTDVYGGRVTLRIDPGDGWTIDLGGIAQDTHGDDSQYADRDLPPLSRASRIGQGFGGQYRLGQVVVSKQWDGLRLLSSTGYIHQQLTERYDASLPDGPLRIFRQHNDTRLFTTENRLSRPMQDGFGWVLGFSYIDNRTRLDRSLGAPEEPLPVTGVTNRIREVTGYGEVSKLLFGALTVTVGGRYTHAKLTGSGNDMLPTHALAFAGTTASRTESSFLPSVSISTTPLDKLTFYARFQEGFRPGGLAIDSGYVRRFRNDRVATLETGLRYGTPGRDTVDFSASGSYTRWKNIQADFIDESGLPSTDNIGNGRIWSVSATAGWQPIPGLRADVGFTFNDSRVTEPSPAYYVAIARANQMAHFDFASDGTLRPLSDEAIAAAKMSRIPNVARFAARVGLDYRTRLGDGMDLRVGGYARYIGKSRLGIGPVLGEAQGDYLDTALSMRIGRPQLGFTLTLTNLTDSIGNRFALGTPFNTGRSDQITPLRPRTIRLGVDAAF
ncbi:TonB-dependent receptor [Flavisphingomonas formosensis]|uniref:TonB-dependent receptor n=1 Tax=Flavisphingomonas formosensis TaxID=861534 RepID=UPI0012FBAFE7|nr:TonB-dependent receptor [Sphingomonas formosensis]